MSTERDARLDELALAAAHGADDAVVRRPDRELHLHRFEDDQRVAAASPCRLA